MVDFSRMSNKAIMLKLRRKLYGIICEHVKNFDDENALSHVKNFMEGVSWTTSLLYEVCADGRVYVYLKDPDLYVIGYEVADIYIDTRILRNSINRHYHKRQAP